jgi:hypothetical protein
MRQHSCTIKSYLWRALAPLGCVLVVGCGGTPELPPIDGGVPTDCKINDATNGIEICNNRDDDCNGLVDDAMNGGALKQACSSLCGGGTEQCVRGQWTGCTAKTPAAETCNGADDDCNGETDEGCDCVHGETRPCGEDEGACRAGIEQCIDGSWSGTCIGAVGPVDEVCNNGLDDNCDAAIDEGCQCTEGETQVCGTDTGACTAGLITCGADSRWGATCEGEVAPRPEVCNGLDDDCDGQDDWSDAIRFGWRADPQETNESCGQAVNLATAVDGGDWISVPVNDPTRLTDFPTMYPPGDQDWYTFHAEEVSHGACFPGASQCAYVLVVQLELSDPDAKDDYEVCFTTQACSMITTDNLYCSNSARWVASANSYVMAIKWAGVCGGDDSRDVRAVVRSKGAAAACGYYQLHARFYFDENEACP